MAKGKNKRGRKMPAWKRWLRAGVSAFGTVLGVSVAASPTFRGLRQMSTGDFEGGIDSIQFDIGAPSKGGGVNVTKLIGFGVTVGVGLGLMMLFKHLARRA